MDENSIVPLTLVDSFGIEPLNPNKNKNSSPEDLWFKCNYENIFDAFINGTLADGYAKDQLFNYSKLEKI